MQTVLARPRNDAPPGAAPSAGSMEVLERTVRLTLATAEKAEAVCSATNLVFLSKIAEDHTTNLDASTLWNNTKPEWSKDAETRVPHELGQKRVFMFASVLDLMQNDSELQSSSEVQKAFKHLASLEPAVLERWVSQFKP